MIKNYVGVRSKKVPKLSQKNGSRLITIKRTITVTILITK